MASSFWQRFFQCMSQLVRLSLLMWLGLLMWLPWPVAVGQDAKPMDQEVLLRIKQQIQSDIRLRDASLDIRVMAGQVTLQGELPSFLERNRLERICRRIQGVDKVVDRIVIAPVPETDQDLQQAVERRLASDPVSRLANIRVETDGTIVRLSGTVPSLYERRHSQLLAEQVRGVSRVRNELTLGTSGEPAEVVPDDMIIASIRKTLGEDARSLAQPIQVSVKDGVVTLEGEVDSQTRKRFYRDLIERMSGVRQVENRLEVRSADRENDARPPSINDAALDVQLALNAAQLVSGELHAHRSDERIAIAGTVDSLSQKQTIIRLAQAFASGYPVVDEMEVAVDDGSSARLESELSHVLTTDILLGDASIQVAIDQGVARLTGNVDRFADKVRAERLASTLKGIRAIDNQLNVDWTATISDGSLKQRIEERLKRNRDTADSVHTINLTVEQGRVTLTGRVPSWEIRRQLAAVVSGTDGIRSFENRLIRRSSRLAQGVDAEFGRMGRAFLFVIRDRIQPRLQSSPPRVRHGYLTI